VPILLFTDYFRYLTTLFQLLRLCSVEW